MVQTGGVGAVMGGTAAMALSWGEVTMGIGQMAETKDKAMQDSDTLPGYITRKSGASENTAEIVDAIGGLAPGILTGGLGGNIKGILDAPENIKQSSTIAGKAFESVSLADGVLDVEGATEVFVGQLNNNMVENPNFPARSLQNSSTIMSNPVMRSIISNSTPYSPKKVSQKESRSITSFIKTL
jgi:hypothetical protein